MLICNSKLPQRYKCGILAAIRIQGNNGNCAMLQVLNPNAKEEFVKKNNLNGQHWPSPFTMAQLHQNVVEITQELETRFTKHGILGCGSVKWFSKRLLNLSLRVAQGLETFCTHGLCVENMQRFQDNLEDSYCLHKCSPSQIFLKFGMLMRVPPKPLGMMVPLYYSISTIGSFFNGQSEIFINHTQLAKFEVCISHNGGE